MMRKLLYRALNTEFVRLEKGRVLKIPPELVQLRRYSLSGIRVLQNLYNLGKDVTLHNVPGDFVECGVFNGGSAAAIACAFRGTTRKVWLYDSFQGLPRPQDIDGPVASEYAGDCVGSEEKVREAMRIAGFPQEQYIIRKGWFKDTFHDSLPKAISLLHIDADWYESVILS